jgi:outer membrane protein assembly factor BamB
MASAKRRVLSLFVGAATAAGLTLLPAGAASPTTDWPQWGQNPQHQGFVSVAGQELNRILADVVYDPNVPAEQAASGGDLLAHYQAPLVRDLDVFMEAKSGPFTDPDHWASQIWHQKRFHWEGSPSALVEKWDFVSDWKPVPNGPGNGQSSKRDRLGLGGWEPVYHAVLANGFVYDPGFGGTIFKLNRGDGTVVSRINPFGGAIDPQTFVAGPISADDAGNVYYNALKLDATDPWGGTSGTDVVDSWLVKVAADDSAAMVSYKSLVSGAPTTCTTTFTNADAPWPPSPTATPALGPCGSQRVGLNVAPAISPDGGTIYSVSRAHLRSRYSYVVAVNQADLSPKWAASLRGRLGDAAHPLGDGCGVFLPIDGGVAPDYGCRKRTPPDGRDPATNEATAGRVIDQSSSSPTVAPDGSIFYGAYSRYNAARGHLFKISSSGQFLGSFRFGWDSTPAIFPHDGTYSVVIKDNKYAAPGSPGAGVPPDESFFISQLKAGLTPAGSTDYASAIEWSFRNTNFVPVSNPNGFEWCINAPAVDANGVVYANSEDGNVYAINQGGTLKQKIFLRIAIGAAYTPLSIGADGKLYTENDGHMFVVGT